MIMRASEHYLTWEPLQSVVKELFYAAEQGDCIIIRQLLRQVVDGYVPQGKIVDLLFNQKRLSAVND